VETPLLGTTVAPDRQLEPFKTRYCLGTQSWDRFLQTSPEFAMKRLLAAGAGPIYQICKAFRNGEQGKRHNPEFTLLEWYRPDWPLAKLIAEVNALLQTILTTPTAQYETYQGIFERYCGFDPHAITLTALIQEVKTQGWGNPSELSLDKDGWLDYLFSFMIQPQLGWDAPLVVQDFPASQAALAQLKPYRSGYWVAQRFEVFIQGLELANGYYELQDNVEQTQRFEASLAERLAQGKMGFPLDQRLLAALAYGLPACSGVALGLDRLLMLALGASTIAEVISFDAQHL
jgi:lysyl-tRNA synthetase class 2